MSGHARWWIPGVGLALGLGLALLARDTAPELGPAERAQQVGAAVAPSPAAAAPEAAVAASPDVAAAPVAPAAPAAPPAPEAPPATERSWALPLELGWDGAVVAAPLQQPIAFRQAAAHAQDALFRAVVTDARGARYAYDVPVRGLIPQDLADGTPAIARGDHVLLARAPMLLRVPDVPFPASVELLRPDGATAAVVDLSTAGGEPTARVR